MKHSFIVVAAAFTLGTGVLLSSALLSPVAAQQSALTTVSTDETKTLAVENMYCALCPVTVRKAIEGVDGVRSVEVDLEAKTATVTFDPSATNLDAIAAASTNAGYPAHPEG